MLKYLKGYIFNGLTFVVNKEDVHNAKDEMFVEATALLPMPDIHTNGGRIQTMSTEELAEWLTEFSSEAFAAGVFKMQGPLMTKQERLDWLQQPAEEG